MYSLPRNWFPTSNGKRNGGSAVRLTAAEPAVPHTVVRGDAGVSEYESACGFGSGQVFSGGREEVDVESERDGADGLPGWDARGSVPVSTVYLVAI